MKQKVKLTGMVALILALFVLPQICMGADYDITQGTPYVYDTDQGHDSFLSKVDDTHYLCAYRGLLGTGYEGVAVVFTVNTSDWTLSTGTDYRFGTYAVAPCLSQIDATHYLCAYQGAGTLGKARVLTVNTTDWTVSAGTAYQFDSYGTRVSLSKIDATHYLCAYMGSGYDGWAVVLTVNTTDWTVSSGTAYEYDTGSGLSPKLSQIDATHYLCAYYHYYAALMAVVLNVNTTDWTISKGTAYSVAGYGERPDLAKIDDTHYLCSYKGTNGDGYAGVLIVDTGDWTVTSGAIFEFDTTDGNYSDLAQIDGTHYLCAYYGPSGDGYAVVLTVNAIDWSVSKETPYEYNTSYGKNPDLAKIDDSHYLDAYTGSTGYQGWSTVLIVELPAIIPDPPVATAATTDGTLTFFANWNASTGATGYYLDVATDLGFTAFLPGYNNLDVGSVTTYSVTALSAVDHYYRLRAYNANGTSGNSNVIVVSGSTLPVELSSFTATYSAGSGFVSLRWATASETDVIGFNIYRSENDDITTSGEPINASLISGHGTTSETNEYSFIDEAADPYYTTYYYWLEVINCGGTSDVFGSYKYIPIDVNNNGELDIITSALNPCYPNPARIGNEIQFNFCVGGLEGTTRYVELKVYNVLGKLVAEIVNGERLVNNYTETWRPENLSNGVYFYQLKTENYNEVKKMFLIR